MVGAREQAVLASITCSFLLYLRSVKQQFPGNAWHCAPSLFNPGGSGNSTSNTSGQINLHDSLHLPIARRAPRFSTGGTKEIGARISSVDVIHFSCVNA